MVDPPGSWRLTMPTRARIRVIDPPLWGKVTSVATGRHNTNCVATQGGRSRQRPIRVASDNYEEKLMHEH